MAIDCIPSFEIFYAKVYQGLKLVKFTCLTGKYVSWVDLLLAFPLSCLALVGFNQAEKLRIKRPNWANLSLDAD